ncbi:MAG TPA: septation protein IspZ [Spirochaetota bacterium]|nr:septation protein IspZ [Spirochaetota bacterium]
MPLTLFLKQMLPGLLPLFIFIIADEIWGTLIGLYVAVIFGVLELVVTRIKDRRWDGFIILDTAFLVLLGGISIMLDNAIFFKLKPALLEIILCIILAAAAMQPEKIFMLISSRYMKNTKMKLNDNGIKTMRRMILFMALIFAAHTVLTVYAALCMSQGAWAFISGGLFYIIFAVIMAGQFIMMYIRKIKNSANQQNIS